MMSAVSSVPAWRRRIRNVTILHEDGFELLRRIKDSDKAVIYCDPPYVAEGGKYKHKFCGIDHYRLAKELKRFQHARVVVSYFDHPEISRWYEGWTIIQCPQIKRMPNTAKMAPSDEKVISPEILITNGPSYV